MSQADPEAKATDTKPPDDAAEREPTSGTRLWLVLMRAYRAIAGVAEAQVAGEGMCLSDFAVLEVLLHKGSLPISTIGEKVLLTNASMTSAVDRLEERGLVRRKHDGCDRRVRQVELTGSGRELITDVFARHERELERIMAGLDEAERSQLRAGLKTIGLTAKAMSDERVAARRTRPHEDRGSA